MKRPVPPVAHEVARRLGVGPVIGAEDVEELPQGAGAYVLVMELKRPVEVPVRRLGNPVFMPGVYLYCGSARGPGGLSARVARHLRTEKKQRWHVDYLSSKAYGIAALPITGGNECDLVSRLMAVFPVEFPVTGFGSSDCRCCISHLMRLPG